MIDYDVVYNDRNHYDNGPHAHGDDMLFVPMDGFFSVTESEAHRSRTIAQGTVWFVPGRYVHQVQASPGQRHLCYYVDMSHLSRIAGGSRDIPQPIWWPMSALLHDLVRVRRHRSRPCVPAFGLSDAALDTSILYEIARLSAMDLFNADAAAVIEQIKQFIADHLDEDLRCGTLATRFQLSERTLARWFNRIEGQSLGQYVLQVRLEEGLRLLRSSTLSIADIQAAVGFNSPAHFSYAMRKAFGHAPGALRSFGALAGNR